MKTKIKRLMAFMVISICGVLSVSAQDLTAAQMFIYYGQPKKVSVKTDRGVEVTEFDSNGRVTSVTRGHTSLVYDWADDGSEVKLTAYWDQKVDDTGIIKISELSKKHYSYNIDGKVDMIVDFLDNGAISSSVMGNPKTGMSTKYFYKDSSDMFPDAIEYSYLAIKRSNKVPVSFDRFDSVGNPLEYTQVVKGVKNVTRLTIEYY